MNLHISYDKISGELLVNWQHDELGFYDHSPHGNGIEVKHEAETGDVIGIMIEAVDLIAPDLNDFSVDIEIKGHG